MGLFDALQGMMGWGICPVAWLYAAFGQAPGTAREPRKALSLAQRLLGPLMQAEGLLGPPLGRRFTPEPARLGAGLPGPRRGRPCRRPPAPGRRATARLGANVHGIAAGAGE